MRIVTKSVNAPHAVPERAEVSRQERAMIQRRDPEGGAITPTVGWDGGKMVRGENRLVADDRFMMLAAESANRIARAFNMEIRFEVHEKTDIEIMQVVDSVTDTVIKELPPEEILDMIAKLWETIGVFVDTKA